jgi:hypothetical protein
MSWQPDLTRRATPIPPKPSADEFRINTDKFFQQYGRSTPAPRSIRLAHVLIGVLVILAGYLFYRSEFAVRGSDAQPAAVSIATLDRDYAHLRADIFKDVADRADDYKDLGQALDYYEPRLKQAYDTAYAPFAAQLETLNGDGWDAAKARQLFERAARQSSW